MTDKISQITTANEKTDKISKTFCLAKWHHTTIYLHTGQTHSCYHPSPHSIPLDELINNPSALHNTLQKKKERAEMLVGEKPEGCKYCWNIEDLGDDHISDRMIRNESIYSDARIDEIVNNNWNYNINPEYIELAFSNECNFKCGYCHPMASSSFHNEIKKFGPVTTVKNHNLDISWFNPFEESTNPYVKAWWEWWPEVSKTLNILRITGGEPLMHKSTWRLFEELKKDPKPHIELNINSNLGVKSSLVVKLAENVAEVVDNGYVKKFGLYSSVDTWGDRAEYLRTGLSTTLWEENLDKFLTTTDADFTVMCTFNILSVTSFVDFLEKVLEWRKKYPQRTINFDTPYLKEPLQYDMHILPKEEFLPYFDKILSFIKDNMDNNDPLKFSDLEYQRFRRVRNYFEKDVYDSEKISQGRSDFYNWFDEYDRRRKTNFLQTFPEMESFYNMCKEVSEEKNN